MMTTLLDLQSKGLPASKTRQILTSVEEILIDPQENPKSIAAEVLASFEPCAASIVAARRRQASVMLIYGAHLLRNGAALDPRAH